MGWTMEHGRSADCLLYRCRESHKTIGASQPSQKQHSVSGCWLRHYITLHAINWQLTVCRTVTENCPLTRWQHHQSVSFDTPPVQHNQRLGMGSTHATWPERKFVAEHTSLSNVRVHNDFPRRKQGVDMYDDSGFTVTSMVKPVLQGWWECLGLWQMGCHVNSMETTQETIDHIQNVYDLPSIPTAIRYLHAATGYLLKATWLKVIKCKNFWHMARHHCSSSLCRFSGVRQNSQRSHQEAKTKCQIDKRENDGT